MKFLTEVVLIFSLLASTVHCEAHWSYTNPETSPDKWSKLDNPMCDGVRQSPIALDSSKSFYDANLKPVDAYKTGDFNEKFTLSNNGHSLQVTLPSCQYFLKLNGKEDGKKFCIKQFHFHWGLTSRTGSEHSISGQFFPLEMHIVSYDLTYANDFDSASKGVDGLAVLGLVFREDKMIQAKDTILYKMGLSPDNIAKVAASGTTIEIEPFSVKDLLNIGDAKEKFFRYDGSLTTPPCTENVYWTVIAQSFPVSSEQLNALRKMRFPASENLEYMANNYRRVQQISPATAVVPRVVFKSWSRASGSKLFSLILLLLPIIIILF
ncbi:hypothetical protein Aperf_G00000117728 [Anoplocephala perfoliata]